MLSSKSNVERLKSTVRAFALVLVVFSAISYFISLVVGPILFFSTTDGLAASEQRIHGFTLSVLMLLDLPVPLSTSLGVLFVVIWGFFMICIVLAWFDKDGFLNSTKGALSKSISLAKTNFLYIMPLVGSALIAATIIISSFQETQGVQTGSINFPTTNPYVILTELSFAPLTEEFAFRISTIGLVVGVLLLILYRGDPRTSGLGNKAKLVLLALFSPELAKERVGYRNVKTNGFPRGISVVEWILILVTSVVFGLAHFLAGSGWEIGKVSTAFLAGFVFAIMYVSYGAYASILLHWFFNYYFDVLSVAGAAYGGMFNVLANLANLASIIGGAIILFVFLLLSANRLGGYFAHLALGQTGKADVAV